MNAAEANLLVTGDRFRGNGEGGTKPGDVYPAVTEAEYKHGIRYDTHLFLPEDVEWKLSNDRV